jgi:uncharacterized radical SAM superfamily Fe-S cluster-containing enzyme
MVNTKIKERISAGSKAHFAHKTLSKKSKSKLYNSVIKPIVTRASETWVLKKQIEEKLLVFQRKITRRIYGLTVDPNVLRRRTNEEINNLLKQRDIVRYINAQRIARLGHLERMHEERTTKKITCWKPLSSRPEGRPKKNWTDVLQDLHIMKIKSSKMCVQTKEQWMEIVELAKTYFGL